MYIQMLKDVPDIWTYLDKPLDSVFPEIIRVVTGGVFKKRMKCQDVTKNLLLWYLMHIIPIQACFNILHVQ